MERMILRRIVTVESQSSWSWSSRCFRTTLRRSCWPGCVFGDTGYGSRWQPETHVRLYSTSPRTYKATDFLTATRISKSESVCRVSWDMSFSPRKTRHTVKVVEKLQSTTVHHTIGNINHPASRFGKKFWI
jgi:hypothetical protein